MKVYSKVSSLVWITATLLSGCESNPFPKDGFVTVEKPQAPREVAPPFGLGVPDTLRFREGEESVYAISAYVPEPGKPVLQITGLPAGATYDASTSKITWMPSFQDGNTEDDLLGTFRNYPIKLRLTSTLDSVSALERNVVLQVIDVRRPLEVSAASGTVTVSEGDLLRDELMISSDDFPQGPFEVLATGTDAPIAIERESRSSTSVVLAYRPSFYEVKRSGFGRKNVTVKVVVVAPNGLRKEINRFWQISDARQFPNVSAPGKIEMSPDVTFTVYADDSNGEDVPTITNMTAPFGSLQSTLLSSSVDRHQALYQLTWRGIPATEYGSKSKISYQVCVGGFGNSKCLTKETEVSIREPQVSPPALERDRWPLASIRYLREGEQISESLRVRWPTADSQLSYEVFPIELRDEVQFSGDYLSIQGKTPGYKQFTLRITSRLGQRVSETFTYEVLPRTWPKHLILADTYRDVEAQALSKLLPDSVVVNPTLGGVEGRMLALRRSVIVTTAMANLPGGWATVDSLLAQIPNVVLLTPLTQAAGPKLAAELQELGVTFRGRLKDFGSVPPISEFALLPERGAGLDYPRGLVELSGTTSSESASPLLLQFVGGLGCTGLLRLNHPLMDLPVALACSRRTGGSLIISGVEWADFRLKDPNDEPVMKQWVQRQVQ